MPDPVKRISTGRAERAGDPAGGGPAVAGRNGAAGVERRRRDLEREAAVRLPGGRGRARRRAVEEAAEGAVRSSRRDGGRRIVEDPRAREFGTGLGRERVHRLDERLRDVVLGLQVGEDAGGVAQVRGDRLRRRERLVEVGALAGELRELEPAPDHVAVDRREEAVRQLRAGAAVVEDVHAVERQGRVEEVRADGGVVRDRRLQVPGIAGRLAAAGSQP